MNIMWVTLKQKKGQKEREKGPIDSKCPVSQHFNRRWKTQELIGAHFPIRIDEVLSRYTTTVQHNASP